MPGARLEGTKAVKQPHFSVLFMAVQKLSSLQGRQHEALYTGGHTHVENRSINNTLKLH